MFLLDNLREVKADEPGEDGTKTGASDGGMWRKGLSSVPPVFFH